MTKSNVCMEFSKDVNMPVKFFVYNDGLAF